MKENSESVSEYFLKMKCKQKSCNRNKNLLENGFCNVCNEAIMDIVAEHEAKKKANEALIQDLIGVNEKLGRGETVDQNVANRLIMGGIIVLINKNAGCDENLEARIVDLELEKNSSKSRLESLESWMNRNDVDKEASKKDMKECSNMVVELGKTKNEAVSKKSSQQKCGECGEIFDKNSDFEVHMEEAHKVNKKFKCEVCGKMFLLEWRLRKHRHVHMEKPKKCKFFLNKEPCPFERIGCKFDHDTIEDSDIETVEEEEGITLDQNQCHLCRQQLQSNDHLMDHIEAVHVDYFEGIMEYAATTRT